jgi:DNA-binding winged helix-turn-helix (wHTH) protein
MPRYRFSDFILSPRCRVLVRGGRELSLIPRYFDLLVFLIEHRHEAVHRRDIFDRVWNDVVVSDSALSQGVRTIRRALGDDSREPRFIRTVSRHGYRFVCTDIVEEADDSASLPTDPPAAVPEAVSAAVIDTAVATVISDPFEPLLQRVTAVAAGASDEEDQREAAELLHALGTSETLRRLGTRPRHTLARALMRDTRWETAHAGAVPFLGEPAPIAAASALVRLRLRRAARIVAARWAGASIGGSLAGIAAGATGGVVLAVAPGSVSPGFIVVVLAAIGGACGAIGGAGVGAGLSVAEATARSRRTLALVCGGAIGGAVTGFGTQWLGRWVLAALVGLRVDIGGGWEGLVLGGAAALGYAAATSRAEGGLAAPRGRRRLSAVLITAAACGIGALSLALFGRPLVGGTVHTIAQASQGALIMLTPLGQLIGEPDFGPISRALIGTGEGAFFGLGLASGLTRRP